MGGKGIITKYSNTGELSFKSVNFKIISNLKYFNLSRGIEVCVNQFENSNNFCNI